MTAHNDKSMTLWLCRMPFLTTINRLAIALSGIIIFGLLIYNAYATCARYLFNAPPPGSTEISTFLIPVIVFLGLAHNLETDKHICVDVLLSRMSARKQAFLVILTTAFIAIIAAVLVWKGAALTLDKLDEVSDSDLRLPLFPFYIFVPIGALLLLLQAVKKMSIYFFESKRANIDSENKS